MGIAQVAELVDAHVSGACAARRAGSSPVLGTLFFFFFISVGEVAELVDALLGGGSVNCDVGVRVSSSSLSKEEQAEIAQLVEHNLAKVGVAGPSPVFRSFIQKNKTKPI